MHISKVTEMKATIKMCINKVIDEKQVTILIICSGKKS